MCNSIHHLGREYQSPAQLAELLGGAEKLVWSNESLSEQDHVMHGPLSD
jgi:hypothetical protein